MTQDSSDESTCRNVRYMRAVAKALNAMDEAYGYLTSVGRFDEARLVADLSKTITTSLSASVK